MDCQPKNSGRRKEGTSLGYILIFSTNRNMQRATSKPYSKKFCHSSHQHEKPTQHQTFATQPLLVQDSSLVCLADGYYTLKSQIKCKIRSNGRADS
jgi:hypothetical protein